MKLLFLIVILSCLATLLSAQSTSFDITPKLFPTNKFCRRKIEVDRNEKTIKFTSKALCTLDRLNATAVGSFSEMEFLASLERFPLIAMKAKTAIKIVTPITKIERELAIVVGSAFGVDRIIEYQETSGVEGYQPGNDTVVKIYNLREQTWKIVDLSKKLLNDSDNSYIYHALVETNITNFCTVRMSAVISTATVQIDSSKFASRAGVVQVLNPSSLKVSFELANIQYSQSNSLIALGTIVAFRGSRREKSSGENETLKPSSGTRESSAVEKPDDANDDQAVSQFDNDLNTQLDGNQAILPKPFFSFQKFISKYSSSSPTVVTRGKLIYTPFRNIEGSLNSDEQFIKDKSEASNAVVARFWVSLTERVENVIWDPSSGSSENSNYLAATSGASSQSLISFLLVLISLIICNLL
ncbi:predicted protein [Naegleria gruberi]|uniref:Predicted protein n=1 Tax=Naegleria gruberi TaxID=5762 RepID=D2V0A4_NAEGR|nr:uncharacterized protein NAEGRDRAFT_62223 [Naegleria gruberi]EFC49681.1 predicted protein [Naegleria gruberi]|eukprot:XP_002682425.1 predicted protein [Naegleria gruberi strain NEG-M]